MKIPKKPSVYIVFLISFGALVGVALKDRLNLSRPPETSAIPDTHDSKIPSSLTAPLQLSELSPEALRKVRLAMREVVKNSERGTRSYPVIESDGSGVIGSMTGTADSSPQPTDTEKDGADQPATAPKSKSQIESKPQLESELRSQ